MTSSLSESLATSAFKPQQVSQTSWKDKHDKLLKANQLLIFRHIASINSLKLEYETKLNTMQRKMLLENETRLGPISSKTPSPKQLSSKLKSYSKNEPALIEKEHYDDENDAMEENRVLQLEYYATKDKFETSQMEWKQKEIGYKDTIRELQKYEKHKNIKQQSNDTGFWKSLMNYCKSSTDEYKNAEGNKSGIFVECLEGDSSLESFDDGLYNSRVDINQNLLYTDDTGDSSSASTTTETTDRYSDRYSESNSSLL